MAKDIDERKEDYLKILERSFHISALEMKRIIKSFHAEMAGGLAGRPSSLKMLPAYIDRPTGSEKGEFLALDLGGTNFRVLKLCLKGRGRIAGIKAGKYAIPRKLMKSDGSRLFSFLAKSIKEFLRSQNRRGAGRDLNLGFTFSFPMKQTGIASGLLIVWTKGFRTKNVVGKDVVNLLKEALVKEGIRNIRIAALANDTVGTLVARAYKDRNCDVGVIIGTGTNACYVENTAAIKKLKGRRLAGGHMIINIEWGNFDKLKTTVYDRRLDRDSENPRRQILEKMVSGMYLGEIARLVLMDMVKAGLLFRAVKVGRLARPGSFKTEYITDVEVDGRSRLLRTAGVLSSIGINASAFGDRVIVRRICELVSARSARIAAAAIAAVITKTDSSLSGRHTVAIDGSVYEKNPLFARKLGLALKEIFGPKTSGIKVLLSKDGSGKGAAIIAAVAASRRD